MTKTQLFVIEHVRVLADGTDEFRYHACPADMHDGATVKGLLDAIDAASRDAQWTGYGIGILVDDNEFHEFWAGCHETWRGDEIREEVRRGL